MCCWNTAIFRGIIWSKDQSWHQTRESGKEIPWRWVISELLAAEHTFSWYQPLQGRALESNGPLSPISVLFIHLPWMYGFAPVHHCLLKVLVAPCESTPWLCHYSLSSLHHAPAVTKLSMECFCSWTFLVHEPNALPQRMAFTGTAPFTFRRYSKLRISLLHINALNVLWTFPF